MTKRIVSLSIAALAFGCSSSSSTDATTDTTAPADTSAADTVAADTAAADTTAADTATADAAEADTATADAAEADTTTADTTTADTTTADTTTADVTGDTDVTETPGEFGFTFRTPPTKTFKCDATPMFPEGEVLEQTGPDWLCTFAYEGKAGHVYIQSSLTGCDTMGFPVPSFTAEKGYISIDGAVTELTDLVYDAGGNHRNDSLTFTWNSVQYRFYHSSFGFGFRACHEMDCMQVLGSGVPVAVDGCTTDRTLPVVCRAIKADGTHEPLTDTFAKCLGDPNL